MQRRATKVPKDTRDLSYDERLSRFRLDTLEKRRLMIDLTQQYRIINGIDIIEWYSKSPLAPSFNIDGPAGGLRGNNKRLEKEITQNENRLNFFINRVVTPWNALDNSIVNASNLKEFKSLCDRSALTTRVV